MGAPYEIRSPGGDPVPLDMPIEDAMAELKRVSTERGKKLSLHRSSDGAKLAVAAPPWRGVTTADTTLPGDPKMVPRRASAVNLDLLRAPSARRRGRPG